MSRMTKLLAFLTATALAPCLLVAAGPASAANEEFTATSAITIPGNPITSFDISFVDPAIGLYLLADRSNKAIDVVDTTSNTVVGQFGLGLFTGTAACVPAAGANDCAGPNGVLTVDNREIWAGDGDSTIKVFEIAAGPKALPTHTISTGGKRRADELCFDPIDHVVLMANDAEEPFPFVTFISTKSYSVIGKPLVFDGTNGTVKATNGIEQCQWSPRTRKFLLNIPEVSGPGDDTAAGAVVVLDPVSQKVERIFNIPLDKCAGPQGMALGPENQVLLGCNAPGPTGTDPSAIINVHSGAVIATLPNESGADEVWFNPGDGHYFLARSSAVPPGSKTLSGWPGNASQVFDKQMLGVVDSGAGRHEDQSVVTAPPSRVGGKTTGQAPGSHSVAADPVKNQVYVPIGAFASNPTCSSAGGSSTQGCIAVFTTKKLDNDDMGCLAQGAPALAVNGGEATFLRGRCR
jgi:hypothetical protein